MSSNLTRVEATVMLMACVKAGAARTRIGVPENQLSSLNPWGTVIRLDSLYE